MVEIVLANVGFRLRGTERVMAALRAHFAGFEGRADGFDVDIAEADARELATAVIPFELDLSVEARHVHARVAAEPGFFPPGSLQNLLRVLLLRELVPRGGLLLHASSADGRVFFGRSGAGKSTLARGFAEETLLSDEIALIDPALHLHRAPFTGERLPPPRPLSTPLRALYAIERGPTFSSTRLSEAEAVRRVMTCVVNLSFDRAFSAQLFDNTAALCARVPVFAATFPRLPDDESAARALFRSFGLH